MEGLKDDSVDVFIFGGIWDYREIYIVWNTLTDTEIIPKLSDI